MKTNNLKEIKGGKTIIEEQIVKALFDGNEAEVKYLNGQLSFPSLNSERHRYQLNLVSNGAMIYRT
jgi:hypothetical protein